MSIAMSTTTRTGTRISRRRRRLRALGLGAGALVLVWLVVCTVVVLHPDVTEDPQPADEARVAHARDLMDQGLAPTVVYATPQGDFGAGGETGTDEIDKPHCDQGKDYEVICFEPDPSTTQGEAMKMRELVAERGWDNIIVITMRPHVSRAQLIVCLLYTSPSPRDVEESRMPSSA